jgi:hypothetical protein
MEKIKYVIEGEYMYPDDFFGAIHYTELWEMLSKITVINDCIEQDFLNFPIGTDKIEIWHWFEESFNTSIKNIEIQCQKN